jgi:hypothetical protein
MKKTIFSLIVVFICLLVLLEKQAGYCGASLWNPTLPYGVRPNWFNGSFTLDDAEGWGVLYNLTKVQSLEGPIVQVDKILRYSHDKELYVEIESIENKTYYVPIDQPNFMASRLIAYDRPSFHKYLDDEKFQALNWTPVGPENCFFSFGLFRVFCVSIIIFLGIILRLSNNPDRAP